MCKLRGCFGRFIKPLGQHYRCRCEHCTGELASWGLNRVARAKTGCETRFLVLNGHKMYQVGTIHIIFNLKTTEDFWNQILFVLV